VAVINPGRSRETKRPRCIRFSNTAVISGAKPTSASSSNMSRSVSPGSAVAVGMAVESGAGDASSIALSGGSVQEDDSLGVTLLKDIQRVFTDRKVDRLFSVDLASTLVEFEESPWLDIRGKPLNAGKLAKMLKPFNIKPRQIRIAASNLKGYLKEDFIDAWERYTPYTGETGETPKHFVPVEASDASEDVSHRDDSGETGFLEEALNRAYVSDVSPVSVPGGIGVLGEDDAEEF